MIGKEMYMLFQQVVCQPGCLIRMYNSSTKMLVPPTEYVPPSLVIYFGDIHTCFGI